MLRFQSGQILRYRGKWRYVVGGTYKGNVYRIRATDSLGLATQTLLTERGRFYPDGTTITLFDTLTGEAY